MVKRNLVFILALFAVVVIVLLVACGEPAPNTGTVIDKKFEPAHWESGYRTEYRPEFQCRNKSVYDYTDNQYKTEQVCGTEMESYQVYEEHHHFVQDRWRLRLEKCNEQERDCKRGWRTVSESTYREHPLQSFFDGD